MSDIPISTGDYSPSSKIPFPHDRRGSEVMSNTDDIEVRTKQDLEDEAFDELDRKLNGDDTCRGCPVCTCNRDNVVSHRDDN